MFVEFQYPTTPNAANLLQAIVKLMTGATTDITQLDNYAELTAAASSIVPGTTPLAWTVHDNISASAVVLKSAIAGTTKFKYLHFNVVSGYITVTLYTNWNATTHTGTGAGYYNSSCGIIQSHGQVSLAGKINTFYFSLSNVHFAQTQKTGDMTAQGNITIMSEYSRGGGYDFAEFIPVVAGNLYNNGSVFLSSPGTASVSGTTNGSISYMPFVLPVGRDFAYPENNANGKANVSVNWLFPNGESDGYNTGKFYNMNRYWDGDGSLQVSLIPFGVSRCSNKHGYNGHRYQFIGGSITDKTGIFLFDQNFGNTGDRAVLNGKEYSIWAFGQYGSFRMMIPVE